YRFSKRSGEIRKSIQFGGDEGAPPSLSAAVACLQAPLLERLNLGILLPHGLLQFLVQPLNRRPRHAVRIHGGDVFGQVIASSAHQKMPHSSRKNARKSCEEHCPSSKYKS